MAENERIGVEANVAAACSKLGAVELSGIRLDDADPRLLDISELQLERHVAMHPSAMAYYGSLLKDANRRMHALKRAHERWERKLYSKAKGVLAGGQYKATAEDVKAKMVELGESEMELWDDRLDKGQREVDALSSWFEAWRQKSFFIKLHVDVEEEERWAASGTADPGKDGGVVKNRMSDDVIAGVREVMKNVGSGKQNAGNGNKEG